MVELDTLRALARRGDGADRAFVDGALRLRYPRADEAERVALERLREEVIAAAAAAHGELRARIRGGLRGAALRSCFDRCAAGTRDHFVEEVLGIAYPPLAEAAPEPELVSYCPSGYDEIVHALDATAVRAGDRFLDIGSGAGKSVLLACALCGAVGAGVERDGPVHELAVAAARDLALDARFALADARTATFDGADVVFMYIPFTGATLAAAVRRVVHEVRPRFLCSGALDLATYPELTPAGTSRSWLHVYAVTLNA